VVCTKLSCSSIVSLRSIFSARPPKQPCRVAVTVHSTIHLSHWSTQWKGCRCGH
jgi:hypothetical protein